MSASDVKLFLAPMEGVVDWVMRDTLTRIGGIDQCVTEFLRVTDRLHPESVFYKNCPELKTGSRTRWGTPVFVQLLGGHAEPLALNAQRAVKLGALGVDLNFGCPAKTVNRHDGGASLLKSCDRVFTIVDTVRKAVPAHVPVTAKIRLGFDDPSKCFEIAKAVEEANATWLTIHCRTKTDGYKPPAYWEWIPQIKERSKIKIIANGEIWNVQDFNRCREVTACDEFMIGRGVLSNPFIFNQIKQSLNNETVETMNWERAKPLLPQFFDASTLFINDYFAVSRTKQWLKALSLKNQEAKAVFDEIKILKKPAEFKAALLARVAPAENPELVLA
ncbi:tRNA-dihydrouridine synthase [Bdellovibrio sp. NC01]|uniref:tRNA dihydrouridine synthase n=1 Tax=Bdellovibrio sp. NC01 TaxID=2220073 RepID=UPI00115B28EC|nr:tRNA-dihydrouridine synthase [Bdellovibrio sp. NC01]QDK37162.1 tRNA-dihydrouridine synthase family protein [Bdellovibrio sp. NC01]